MNEPPVIDSLRAAEVALGKATARAYWDGRHNDAWQIEKALMNVEVLIRNELKKEEDKNV